MSFFRFCYLLFAVNLEFIWFSTSCFWFLFWFQCTAMPTTLEKILEMFEKMKFFENFWIFCFEPKMFKFLIKFEVSGFLILVSDSIECSSGFFLPCSKKSGNVWEIEVWKMKKKVKLEKFETWKKWNWKAVSQVFAKRSFASVLHLRASEAGVLRSFHMILSFFPLVSNSHKSIEIHQLHMYLNYMYQSITCISITYVSTYKLHVSQLHVSQMSGQGRCEIWVVPGRGRISVLFLQNFKTLCFSFFYSCD